jgi:hypothetical protein
MAGLFTVQSVCFYIRNKNLQVVFAEEAFQFHYRFLENHDITVQPAVIHVFVGKYAPCLFFITAIWNGPATELKCKIDVRENIPLVFYRIETVGA